VGWRSFSRIWARPFTVSVVSSIVSLNSCECCCASWVARRKFGAERIA
jgi:hypothetical protein